MGTLLMGALLSPSASQVLAGQAHASPVGAHAAARLAADVGPLQATPQAYLPIVWRQYFLDYTYQDDFSNPASGWPVDTRSEYGYEQDADGSQVYYIRSYYASGHKFVSGPGFAIGNFDYQAEVRLATTVQPLAPGDQYGILISPAPIDPNNASGGPVYALQVQLQSAAGQLPNYVVTKWTSLAELHKTVLKQAGAADWLTNLPKFWNRLRIVRSGNQLDFYISRQKGASFTPWQHVFLYAEPTLPEQLYVGFLVDHAEGSSYLIEFQFDNVFLHVYQ